LRSAPPLERKPSSSSTSILDFEKKVASSSIWTLYSSTVQLVDFFGWKNGSMYQEYIYSSKPAILGMASRLGGFEALSQDPVVEVEVEMEKDPLDTKSIRQEMEEYIILEEDPEMYAMVGIELVPVPVQERIESTIRQAMSSVPTVNGATVNVKIVVLNDNSGNLTF
jgi:hypothetical protein